MQRLKNDIRGITLMVLVITIIIMLILAAVVVKLTLGDEGVLSEARSAVNEWDKATDEEQSDLSKLAQEMKNARNGIYNKTTGNEDSNNENTISSITGNETTNTDTKDKLGNKIVIPAGFKVVNPEDDVTKGIVIEDVSANNADTVGNQFVWVPCTLDGANGSLKYDRYAFTRETPTWTYRQSLVLGTNKEYEKDSDGSYKIQRADDTSHYYHEALSEKEKVSIERYGGFYIGRYEVGVNNGRSESSKGNITTNRQNKSKFASI